MLYKNKKNVLRGVVAFVFMLTLSLSTALSPLAKAEEARWTWKAITSVSPSVDNIKEVYVSLDGSKLFIQEEDSSHNTNLWMSADDGATWRKIWSKQAIIGNARPLFSVDGSKIAVELFGGGSIYVSVDGGQSWTERQTNGKIAQIMSPDGSFLAGCSVSSGAYTTYISTDDGQTWTQKGTSSIGCPSYVTNNGTLIATDAVNKIAKSTDYGQTWTEISNFSNNVSMTSFSNNGNNVFDGDRISLDGGNHWTSLNPPVPAGSGYPVYRTGISDDGKKLFFTADPLPGSTSIWTALFTSVDGGRTWSYEAQTKHYAAMSNDGSKLFNAYTDNNGRFLYRLGTLSTPQPVTPGAGAGGAATPSVSTSAAPGQKPGKASGGRLAETGTSTWMVGGLAVVAVAAGALVLRKRL